MVFYDDDKKIKELGKRPPSKTWRRAKRALIVAAVLGGMFAAGLGLLASVGGTRPELRKGLEDYLAQATGMKAQVGRLDYLGFYPELRVDAHDISLGDPPQATVGEAHAAMGFWDVFFSRPQLRQLEIKDISLDAGLLTKKALHIDKAALAKDNYNGKPGFKLSGQYGSDYFYFAAAMDRHEEPDGRAWYRRPRKGPFEFESPFLKAAGTLSQADGGGLQFDFDGLGAPDKVLSGRMALRKDGELLRVTGDLKGAAGAYDFDLQTGKEILRGSLSADPLAADDLQALAPLYRLYGDLAPPPPENAPLIDKNAYAALQVKIKKITLNGADLGSLSFPVKMAEGVLTAGPLAGKIADGKIGGRLVLNAAKSPAALSLKGKWDDFRYGEIEKALYGSDNTGGTATAEWTLDGTGNSYDALLKSLKGEAAAVAGPGRLNVRALDIWGRGLSAVMLPSFDPSSDMRLNCLIADFKVADGAAKADPLFLDTKNVTVSGEGAIDLPGGGMDMKFTPQSKTVALLNAPVSVQVRGPWSNPSVTPDALSLGTAIGKIFLGTVNPAFMAFSMSDLGLTKNHPCAAYIAAPGK